MIAEPDSTPSPPASWTALSRIVWIYWNTGFADAPEVIGECVHSWRQRNPGWRVVELSDANLSEFVDAATLSSLRSLNHLSTQKFANLIRLYLVATHGGVWADATCYCQEPLDDWLPDYIGSGFFVFRRRPAKWLEDSRRNRWQRLRGRSGDRVIANWFIAAVKGNELASRFFRSHLELFLNNSFSLQGAPAGYRRVRVAGRLINRNAWLSQLWTHPFIAPMIKAYPYFIFHYHFARVISEDPVCRTIWDSTPVFYCEPLTRLKRHMTTALDDRLLTELPRLRTPVHKLAWRFTADALPENSALDYLRKNFGQSEVVR